MPKLKLEELNSKVEMIVNTLDTGSFSCEKFITVVIGPPYYTFDVSVNEVMDI